jgi:hypothetical protein
LKHLGKERKLADPIKWELRASGSLGEIKQLLTSEERSAVLALHELTGDHIGGLDDVVPVACAGNQHTCQPTVFIPAMNQRFDLIFTGSGDSVVVGHHSGPRALVWKDTVLTCSHPTLGDMTITLDPAQDHAGTIVPLLRSQVFPALNRNTYFFVLKSPHLGELISDRPAIVEALIDTIPPTARYEFKNAPLNFYLRSDPERKVVAIIEKAATDVRPA